MTSSFPSVLWEDCTWGRKICHQYGDSASSENLCHHLHLNSSLWPYPATQAGFSFIFPLLFHGLHTSPCVYTDVSSHQDSSCANTFLVYAACSSHEAWGRSLTPCWVDSWFYLYFFPTPPWLGQGLVLTPQCSQAFPAQGTGHLHSSATRSSLSNISISLRCRLKATTDGQFLIPNSSSCRSSDKQTWVDLLSSGMGSPTRSWGFIPGECVSYSIKSKAMK